MNKNLQKHSASLLVLVMFGILAIGCGSGDSKKLFSRKNELASLYLHLTYYGGKPATPTGMSTGDYAPTAAFLGNQEALVGEAIDRPNTVTLSAVLLVRETNCSLTPYVIGGYDANAISLKADAYLQALPGLNFTGSYPSGCQNRTLGIPSAPAAYIGRTVNGDLLAAGPYNNTLKLVQASLNTAKPVITATNLASGVAETIAVADFNGDNIADIVTPFIKANNQSGVGVFLSKADGTFNPVNVYTAEVSLYSSRVSIEDINADGKLDIVALGGQDALSTPPKPLTLSTLLGNGDGSFRGGPSLTETQAHPFSVFGSPAFVITDFNGDNKKDVLTAAGFWLHGNGDGSFQPSEQRLNATLEPRNLAVGDFNGDNKLDVATSSLPGGGSPTISIFTGAGDGHFTPGASYAGMAGADYLTSTDINGDGYTDIHVGLSWPGVLGADANSSSVRQFLFGNGDATFLGAQALPGAGVNSIGPSRFALADFSGNGFPSIISLDAATADSIQRPTELNLRTASANGQFGAPSKIATLDFPPSMLTAGDLNGDGKPDIIAAGWTRMGLGGGKFADPQNNALPGGVSAVGDFNGDLRTDVVVSMGGQSAVDGGAYVYFAKPDGSMEAPMQIDSSTNVRQVATGDLNNDGRADLTIVGFDPQFYQGSKKLTGIRVYLGNADGSFSAPLNLSLTSNFSAIAIADMNKDQKADLVAGSYDKILNSSVVVFTGLGDGSFGAAKTLALANGGPGVIAALAVADFTADGKPDVMIAGQHYTEVLGGNGDGSLTGENALIIAGGAGNLVVTDLNKDTLPDVVARVTYQGIVPLLRVKSALGSTLNNDVDTILNWGEKMYPDLLSSHEATKTYDKWLYRYYVKSDLYVGINMQDNGVYYIAGMALGKGENPVFLDSVSNVLQLATSLR